MTTGMAFTDEELARIERRDQLAYRKAMGEELTETELARLGGLNTWLDAVMEREYGKTPGLSEETLALVDEVHRLMFEQDWLNR